MPGPFPLLCPTPNATPPQLAPWHRRAELKALVDIHKEGQEFGGVLSADEVNIIKGALDMTHKIAGSAMTPLDMVRGVESCGGVGVVCKCVCACRARAGG